MLSQKSLCVVISNPRHLNAVNDSKSSTASQMLDFIRHYAAQPLQERAKLEQVLIESFSKKAV